MVYTYNIEFDGTRVMELGGGNNPLFHPNVDAIPGSNVDIVSDFNNPDELLVSTRSYTHLDGIYGAYVIEHVSWRSIDKFVQIIYHTLREDGKAIFLTANIEVQCKLLSIHGANKDTIEMLFGSQEFPNHAGCHKMGFSPKYAQEIFDRVGFGKVTIHALPMPHVVRSEKNLLVYPSSHTDMIIEAIK